MEFKQWFEQERLLNEVDWEGDFSDVQKTCEDPEKVAEYLNAVRANASIDYGKREKFNINLPFVHAKSSFFKPDGDLDLDYFIEKMTEPPTNIVNTNEKILKSGGPHEFVYKTGIPAFRGLVYDKKAGKFIVINTCPGAGACVVICYARHGRYVQYPNAYDSMTRRLNYLLNHPDKYQEQLKNELKEKCKEHEAFEGYKAKVILRWNDSGDFFSKKYQKIADDTILQLKKEGFNIESYAYTKVADVAKGAQFGGTTFSSGSNNTEAGKVDFQKHKTSIVVPKELFKGLNLMKLADEQKLKTAVAQKFVLPIEKVITYGELMSTPKGEIPQWHVLVTPGDGDDAAFRKDVKTILLTQH
jgi:hypothetical protein